MSRLPRPADLLCFAIHAAGQSLNRLYRPLLEPLGLTYPQYLVMLALWARDGRSVSELGQELFLESSTLTPLLKRLEGAGLVTRQRDAADERVVRAHLSPAGHALEGPAARIPECILAATRLDEAGAEALRDRMVALRRTIDRESPVTLPEG